MSAALDMPRPDPVKIACALFDEVAACLEGRAVVKGHNSRRCAELRAAEQQAAIDYVRSTNRSELFSFENVCDMLDLDITDTRVRLLERVREAA